MNTASRQITFVGGPVHTVLSACLLALLLCPAALAQDRPVPPERARYTQLLSEGDDHLKAERFAEALTVFESLVSHVDQHESLERDLGLALARVAESSVGVGSAAKAKGLSALDRLVELGPHFKDNEQVIGWRRALDALPDPEPERPPGPSAEELAQRERKMAIFAMDELLDRVARPGLSDAERKRHIDALWVYLRPVLSDPLESDIEVWLRAGRFALEIGEQGPVIDRELAAVCGEAILRLGGDAHLEIAGRLQAICGKEAIDRVARLREQHSQIFQRAADGQEWDQYMLAALFDASHTKWEGSSVVRHDESAVSWYRKAAEQRHRGSQAQLGWMYMNGRGVAQNDAEAIKWFRKAAELRNVDAKYHLGFMYTNGRGVPKDDAEAVRWYRRAAEQGHASGQNNLGYAYQHGEGVAMNHTEAVKWYRKAAEQGLAPAQANLGRMYANGRGVARNDAQAVIWFRKSADQGDIGAQYLLGSMYMLGHGVAANESEAVRLWRLAARQGYEEAQQTLREWGETW